MNNKDIQRYRRISRVGINNQTRKINTTIPTPNESDYSIGYVLRFFIQKTNDNSSPIYEVSNSTYNSLLSRPIYKGVILKWRISGPKQTQYDNEGRILNRSVSDSNRITIKLESDKMPNLKLYLPNLLQFHK